MQDKTCSEPCLHWYCFAIEEFDKLQRNDFIAYLEGWEKEKYHSEMHHLINSQFKAIRDLTSKYNNIISDRMSAAIRGDCKSCSHEKPCYEYICNACSKLCNQYRCLEYQKYQKAIRSLNELTDSGINIDNLDLVERLRHEISTYERKYPTSTT